MREKDFWAYVRDGLKGFNLDPIRIENATGVGTPDVNYVDGWIELKVVEAPALAATPVRVDHFTKQQRLWHRRRANAGGRSFVLIRVEAAEAEFFLIDGAWAAERLGEEPIAALRHCALRHWTRAIRFDELAQRLRRHG